MNNYFDDGELYSFFVCRKNNFMKVFTKKIFQNIIYLFHNILLIRLNNLLKDSVHLCVIKILFTDLPGLHIRQICKCAPSRAQTHETIHMSLT